MLSLYRIPTSIRSKHNIKNTHTMGVVLEKCRLWDAVMNVGREPHGAIRGRCLRDQTTVFGCSRRAALGRLPVHGGTWCPWVHKSAQYGLCRTLSALATKVLSTLIVVADFAHSACCDSQRLHHENEQLWPWQRARARARAWARQRTWTPRCANAVASQAE